MASLKIYEIAEGHYLTPDFSLGRLDPPHPIGWILYLNGREKCSGGRSTCPRASTNYPSKTAATFMTCLADLLIIRTSVLSGVAFSQ